MKTEDSSGTFNLDSLLNDLDEVVKQSPRRNIGSNHTYTENSMNLVATTKFIPHPPSISQSQNIIPNPKTKFAVAVDRSPESQHYSNDSFSPIKLQSSSNIDNNENRSFEKDENSLDNLLNLLNSPQQQQQQYSKGSSNITNASSSHTELPKTSFFKPHNNNFPIVSTETNHQFNPIDSIKESEKVFASLGFATSLDCLNTLSTPIESVFPSNDNVSLEHNRNVCHSSNSSVRSKAVEIDSKTSSPFDSPSSNEGKDDMTVHHHRQSYNYIANTDSSYHYGSSSNNNNNNIASNSNNNVSKRIIANTANNSDGNNSNNNGSGTSLIPKINPVKQQSNISAPQEISNKSTVGNDKSFLPAKIGASNNNLYHVDNNKINNSNSSKARCMKVVIAGSMIDRGRKVSSFTKLACDQLRCMKCNFKVHYFLNNSWNPSIDYMFLRNTVPNEEKLAVMLVHANDDSCAYCCQCTSTVVTENNEIELNPSNSNGPQWVCAGHTS